MKILFTGICEDFDALRRQYGEDTVSTPLIEIAAVENNDLQAHLTHIDNYDYLLFTSRFTVRYCMPLLHELPERLRIVSIGHTTTAELHKHGLTNIEQAESDNSYGVIEWFRNQPSGKVLFPRSAIALPIICEGLQQLGFDVHPVTAYTNRMPVNPQKVNINDFDKIVFTSPSTVHNFVKLYGALPAEKELVARGPITQQAINKQLIKQKQL
jgi:uroporphyrinogen-III synthase